MGKYGKDCIKMPRLCDKTVPKLKPISFRLGEKDKEILVRISCLAEKHSKVIKSMIYAHKYVNSPQFGFFNSEYENFILKDKILNLIKETMELAMLTKIQDAIEEYN